jgi:hypothetical protein
MEKQSKLLIIGDSFAASTNSASWSQCLHGFDVDNLSSNGASEYRLIKQMHSVDAAKYDHVIFVHTSPNRIYVEHNPYYTASDTHNDCDLIYTDIHARLPDSYAKNVVWFFENVFDLNQAKYVHNLLIDNAIKQFPNALHMTFFECEHSAVKNLHSIWQNNPGNVNHMNAAGNALVTEFVTNQLKDLKHEQK